MALSYEKKATRVSFTPGTDFGGGADILYYVLGPKGKAGRLYDYGIENVVEALAAGTNLPKMSVGTVADPDHYGDDFSLGAAAIAGGTKSIRTTYTPTDAGFATYMLIRDLPADTVVMVTCTAGTGSGLTGQATPFVEIVWDD